jgi:hypothetical protein
MRTLFWCCCAIVVTVASFVYLAADYAREYPNSVVGRCVLLACRVGCEYSPAALIARAVNHHGCPCQPATAETANDVNDCPCVVNGSAEEQAPADQEPCQIIDLSGMKIFGDILECEEKNVETGDITRELLPPPAACDPRCSGETPVMVPPDRIHENGEEDATDPSCENKSTAPETMPTAKDDAEKDEVGTDPFYELWIGLFKGVIAETTDEPPMATDSTTGSAEEAEAIHDGVAPNMKEDSSCHEQYPGCPAMGGCSAPVTPPDATPRKHKKKVKAVPPMTHQETAPATTTEPEVDEECPTHSDLDTTEFRKTDAKRGEFSPHPF